MLKKSMEESKIKYFIVYTMLFSLLMLIVFSDYIMNGTTLIGYNDSYIQHYPYLLKVKEFYENIFLSIFTDKKVELVDYNSFFGMSTISTLQYYGLGNPLYLLTMGCSEAVMPYVYTALTVLKIYLSGITFSIMCFHFKRNRFFTLLGAIVYVLNPYILASVEQLSFLDALYLLPLLVVGFSQILDGKKSSIFIFSIALSAFNGYYFFYMMTIMLSVYGVVTIVKRNRKLKEMVQDGFSKLWSTGVHYLLGVMVASPIFVPSVLGFLNSYRERAQIKGISFIYSGDYYINELVKLLFYNSDTYFSLNIVVIFAIIVLFVGCKKKYVTHKILIILAVLGVQIPIISTVMNGFSYPSTRWLFGFYLVVSFVCVDVFSHMLKNSQVSKIGVTIVICIGVIMQAYLFSSKYEEACLSVKQIESLKENEAYEKIEEDSRVDGDSNWVDNTALFYNVANAQIYTSVIPGFVIQAGLDNELALVENTSIINGLDSRAELQALFNIEYFVADSEKSDVPYGFEEITRLESGKIIYRNNNILPFGYTYDSYINENEISDLNGIMRSWLYMDTAVVSSNQKVNVKHNENVDISLQQVEVHIEDESEKIRVSFENITNSEVYVRLYGRFDKNAKDQIVVENQSKSIMFEKVNSQWYIDRDYLTYHLGSFENVSEFYLSGLYEYDKIEVYYHSIENYEDKIRELGEYHLENVSFETNKISGDINVPDDRLLCLSIPAIDGWKAYIDGKETEIIVLNGMLMGINVDEGNHNIELEYVTPGLRAGIILFCFGIILIILLTGNCPICLFVKKVSLVKKSKS